MCVTQFRDYCKASEFKHTGRDEDLADKNIIVRQQTHYYNGRSYHYRTDKKQLEKLAKNGNEYALSALANEC